MASIVGGVAGRTWVRVGAIGLAVLVGLAVLAGSASATTYTVHEAMKTLATKLGSESKLEGWGSYSAADKQQIVKGLGIEEFMSREYRDAAPGALLTHYELELDETSKATVKSYGDELVGDAESAVANGPVEKAIGGDLLEDAGAAVATPEALPTLLVIVAGGAAAGAGYYIGTKLVEIFGDSNVESEPGAGAAVTEEAWLRVVPVSGWTETLGAELYTGGPHNWWETSGQVIAPGGGLVQQSWLGGNGYFPGPVPGPGVPVGTPYYLLVFKAEGSEYWSASGPAAMLEGSNASGWFDDYKKEYEEEGCEESSWIRPPNIAGWPPRLSSGHLVTSEEPYHASCKPWTEVLNEKLEWERVYKPEKKWRGMQAYYWRNSTEFVAGLPHPGGECSGECPTPTIPPLPTAKKLAEGIEEGFSGSGPSVGPEGWLESNPALGEEPKPFPAVVDEVTKKLIENNPTTEKTKTEIEETARKCVAELAAAGEDGAEKCTSLPVFAPGSDAATATEHDEEAIAGTPAWATLKYRKKSEAPYGEKWYNSTAPCNTGYPGTEACDEYPFFSSEEGGPGASLKVIAFSDNSLEGSKYGNMVSSCKLTTGEPFVVAPIRPSIEIPTDYLCNK